MSVLLHSFDSWGNETWEVEGIFPRWLRTHMIKFSDNKSRFFPLNHLSCTNFSLSKAPLAVWVSWPQVKVILHSWLTFETEDFYITSWFSLNYPRCPIHLPNYSTVLLSDKHGYWHLPHDWMKLEVCSFLQSYEMDQKKFKHFLFS